mmetsp:Transcript_34418/g.62927  ORF Transcript_34418/g.62927 Transcript_34418/m.62927 type:complete len:322 (-) Transcript_34418:47-1012(-)
MQFVLLALGACQLALGLPSAYPTVPMRGVKGNVRMPLVGLGTANYNNTMIQTVMQTAFEVGYRAFDTALIYGNQQGVGMALHASGLSRDEYFVTSKIMGGLDREATFRALDVCLQQLNLTYVDLMLIHFPANMQKQGSKALRQAQWKAMEEWALKGHARAIGVSHYCKSHVDDTLEVATVPIALNQVLYHVGMGHSPDIATDYKDYMLQQGIVYMSFSTLCGPCGEDQNRELISGPLVTEIGSHYNVTGAQVSLRWAVQQGIPVIPRSSTKKHLASNLDLFSFNLSTTDMTQLNAATTPSFGTEESGDCVVGLSDDEVISV